MSKPKALLFLSGNAAYLVDGRQQLEYQALGWSGLRAFIEKYPSATVEMQSGVVPPEMLPGMLRHLRNGRRVK